MILFKETENGRTFINNSLVIKKLYNFLGHYHPNFKVIDIKLRENDVKVITSNDIGLEDSEIIYIQQEVKAYLKKYFKFCVDEVQISVI